MLSSAAKKKFNAGNAVLFSRDLGHSPRCRSRRPQFNIAPLSRLHIPLTLPHLDLLTLQALTLRLPTQFLITQPIPSFLLPNQSTLLSIHLPKVPTTPQLRRGKQDMQHRRRDLERHRPPRPQAPEEVHRDHRLRGSAYEGRDAGETEELAEEVVRGWIYAVEDYGDVGEEFGDDVEGACFDLLVRRVAEKEKEGSTPDCAENEFYCGVSFAD